MLSAFDVSPALFASLQIGERHGTAPASLDTASAAKLIRHILKAAFPKVKFAVRTSRYAGGSSIDVSWTDGPTHAAVDAMIGGIEGKGFDGMQDMSYAKAPFVLNGVPVRAYCFVQCHRSLSPRLRERAAQQIAAYFGVAAPVLEERGRVLGPDGQYDWSTLIYQACEDRTRFLPR